MRPIMALTLVLGLCAVGMASAEEIVVPMHMVTEAGTGSAIGKITISDHPNGTLFAPDLSGLSPGVHGFHVHQNPDCGPGYKDAKATPGLAAGGHYDPDNKGTHQGPYGNGHRGDLPGLYVNPDGTATHVLLAPRITISELKGRSLLIHAAGDNYSDFPEALGGGGARVACGIVE